MAKTNKYTSINFNHIYEKNLHSSPVAKNAASSSSSFSAISSPLINPNTLYKNHLQSNGRMLVLSRPIPKPVTAPMPPSQQSSFSGEAFHAKAPPDPISLRPLGRTGPGPSVPSPLPNLDKDKELSSISTPLPSLNKEASYAVALPKANKFVPPHRRPGFVPKEERRGLEASQGGREAGFVPRHQHQGYYGSPALSGENGRPKTGGYE